MGDFLWKKDEWSGDNSKSFIDEEELKKISKDFEIIYQIENRKHM